MLENCSKIVTYVIDQKTAENYLNTLCKLLNKALAKEYIVDETVFEKDELVHRSRNSMSIEQNVTLLRDVALYVFDYCKKLGISKYEWVCGVENIESINDLILENSDYSICMQYEVAITNIHNGLGITISFVVCKHENSCCYVIVEET